ncbi:SprB repeat-containing protein [uncultured Pontibacter sp.]|uniref:SprB repeat-containing protein n=1 Tax=uncultured Pontibacter sp. TaxID=453356 RepID=UPI002629BF24|nr:SprB repeat-containing protein [uncultured Pontibacter sp.]
MANYAKVKISGPVAIPEGVAIDINILGVVVRFTSTTYDSGYGTTWSFSQQRAAEYGIIDGAGNAAKLASAISGYLQSIGETRYAVTSSYGTDFMGYANATYVELKAKEYDDALNFPSATVTNSNGSGTFASVYNNTYPHSVTTNITNVACFSGTSGSVSLNITGGVPPYAVQWEDGSTETIRSFLPAGVYNYTVTDSAATDYASGAHPGVVTGEVNIGQNPELKVTGVQDDDSISLTVEGGVAPYTFAWSDGSTDKDRFGLAAGRYEVTVTDSYGCYKSFTFTLGLARFYFSHGPITLELQAQNLEEKPSLTFLCEVWVEKEYLSESFERVATLEHVADRDGSTVFEVQEFLQPFVGAYFPELDEANTTMASGLFKRFYLRHTEKYGAVPTPGDFTVEDYRYVLRGGLSFEETTQNNFYASYLPTQKPFLSWLPAAKLATTGQPEFLFLVLHQSGIESFVVKKRVTYADASVVTSTAHLQEGCQRFEVYCIPTSYQALDLASDGREVREWEIWCETEAGIAITETRTYTLDTRYSGYFRYLLYLNSLGGINTLTAVGQAEKSLEIETQTMQRLLNAGYNPTLGSTETTSVTAEPVLRLTSGYLSDQKELEALTDFALSREVRLVEAGRYRAGTKQVKKFLVLDEVDEQRYLDFEFVLPTEKHYTPTL